MTEKLRDRLKEIIKMNQAQVLSEKAIAEIDGPDIESGGGDLADNLLTRNLHEEMAYLSNLKLKMQEEPEIKESHFFKTMTREQ